MSAQYVVSVKPPEVSAGAADSGREQRIDIQGLRAVAVLAVLIFHLWPDQLTGGYTGVDVFFVISGFLITSHLLRRAPRGPRDVLSFWARRVRRLIPAASLVLLVTLVASWIWLPSTMLGETARQVVASALYVENWVLAGNATDYLAATEQASPVQHYWSLSVEEQFYLLWPLLIMAAAIAGTRLRRRWLPLAVVAAVAFASLAWSIHLTSADPAAAYFVSTTRVWELALGGVLAAVMAWRPFALPGGLRTALAWIGLAMIGWAIVTFTQHTAFPGSAALIPTVGTVLVIAAAADSQPYSPSRVFRIGPVQWTGGVSYSLYLWHWPLIVILPFVLDGELSFLAKLGIVVASLLLAAVTKQLVEDPVRRNHLLNRRIAATFGVLVVSLAVLIGSALWTNSAANAASKADNARVKAAIAGKQDCFGAAAARDQNCDLQGKELITSPAFIKKDKPVTYRDKCNNAPPFTSRITCTYGSKNPTVRIAIAGNSHADHWVPAIQDILAEHPGWQLTTYLQAGCFLIDAPIVLDTGEGDDKRCQQTNRWVMDSLVEEKYDLVILSMVNGRAALTGVPESDRVAVTRQHFVNTLDELTAARLPVLVLRDIPFMDINVPDCLATHLDDWNACAVAEESAVLPDYLVEAAQQDKSGKVTILDVNDTFCHEGRCLPVIGGVIPWFNLGHMSGTYARTLVPELNAAMEKTLER